MSISLTDIVTDLYTKEFMKALSDKEIKRIKGKECNNEKDCEKCSVCVFSECLRKYAIREFNYRFRI